MERPVLETEDGHYLIARGRLWRKSNPDLSDSDRNRLVAKLMFARRAVRDASGDREKLVEARKLVDAAKVGLSERGRSGEPTAPRTMMDKW